MARLIIFVNGLISDIESVRPLIHPGDILYAVDGGTRHVLALGWMPSVVIGDLDSLSLEDRQWLEVRGVAIRTYSRDKDQTDLELALDSAVQTGQREFLIIGALGGRLDQTLANLSLLSSLRFLFCDIRLDDGMDEVFFVRDRSTIYGSPGDIVSLIPWGGQVTGIYTESLRWPLENEALFPDKTRGISNEMRSEMASITIKSGLLLVTHHRQSAISP